MMIMYIKKLLSYSLGNNIPELLVGKETQDGVQ